MSRSKPFGAAGRARRILILCNGEPPRRALARRWAARCGTILAVDGGTATARRCGLRPDRILGDLDSLEPADRKRFRSTPLIRIRRQDNSDLEKALDHAWRRGFEQAVILGAAGRRIDFTLANFASVWSFAARLDITVIGPGWVALPVVGRRQVRARRGAIASLIAVGVCHGVTLRGLKYPLRGASLRPGARGVSNVVRRSPFSVSLRRGRLLLILSDAAPARY